MAKNYNYIIDKSIHFFKQFLVISYKPFNAGTLSELTWRQMFSVNAIIEQLKHLDINKESIECQEQNVLVPHYMNQEQNALVLYSRDGTLLPFQGSFDLIKKQNPRRKVELDEETNRVWKLLMQDINSEGIDGTDEENTKWWEEELRVFHDRVDSFIARMHLVQGSKFSSLTPTSTRLCGANCKGSNYLFGNVYYNLLGFFIL